MTDNLRCKCDLEKTTPWLWCPWCGKYQMDIFLGEPFPPGFDSPLRELIRGIYSTEKVAGKFNEIKGNTLWGAIAKAISRSQICIFDITGDIFNVAYEIGYSLVQEDPAEYNRYIVLCCSDEKSKHVLHRMKIIDSLPQKEDLAHIIKSYYNLTLPFQANYTTIV